MRHGLDASQLATVVNRRGGMQIRSGEVRMDMDD